jgi:hypothetical protein
LVFGAEVGSGVNIVPTGFGVTLSSGPATGVSSLPPPETSSTTPTAISSTARTAAPITIQGVLDDLAWDRNCGPAGPGPQPP